MLTALNLAPAPMPAPTPLMMMRPSQPRINTAVLLQFIVCTLPVPLGFLVDQARAGSLVFLGLLIVCLMYQGYRKSGEAYLSLVLSAIPLLAFLRAGGLVPYSSLFALLASGLAWTVVGRKFASFWRNTTLLWTLGLSFLYWWVTFLRMGDYSLNLRVMEWAVAATIVFMLNSRRAYLASGLLGIGVSVVAVSISLLQGSGDRLGEGTVDELSFGNPILVGMPAALVLLFTFAEGGKWLRLENHPVLRTGVGVICGLLLFLSASRGSLAVAVVGVLVLALFDKRSRRPMSVSLLVLGAALALLIASPRGQSADHYLLKMFDSDRSLKNITSGRSEQWAALGSFLSDSPVWGFGPGSGREVSEQYAGMNLQFHSLFLHVAAEMGGIGLIMLAILLGVLFRAAFRRLRSTGEIAPLLGFAGFICMALSVAGLDSIGGVFIGLAFLGLGRTNLFVASNAPNPSAANPSVSNSRGYIGLTAGEGSQ